MLFCGNTVHSGMNWKEENQYSPRIHFYIDPPGRPHTSLSQSFITPQMLKELKQRSSNIYFSNLENERLALGMKR